MSSLPPGIAGEYLDKIKDAMDDVRRSEWRIASLKSDMKDERKRLAVLEGTLRGVIAEATGRATPSLFSDPVPASPKPEPATDAEASPEATPAPEPEITAKILKHPSGWRDLLIDDELDQPRKIVSTIEKSGFTTFGELADALDQGWTWGFDAGTILKLKADVEQASMDDVLFDDPPEPTAPPPGLPVEPEPAPAKPARPAKPKKPRKKAGKS